MSKGSHDYAGYILTEEADGSKHLVKDTVYNKNETSGELEVAMTKPTDEAKQTLQPFTDIAAFVALQNQSGSLTDEVKVEFMSESDNILHDLIRSNPQLARRLMKFIFKDIVEQNGPNFSIPTSAESFDKIVDNFEDIENIDPDFKKQAYDTFDVALRAFIDSAKSLGSKNTLIAAMYDSMHTTEPINKDEDNSWESCNITIR